MAPFPDRGIWNRHKVDLATLVLEVCPARLYALPSKGDAHDGIARNVLFEGVGWRRGGGGSQLSTLLRASPAQLANGDGEAYERRLNRLVDETLDRET